MKHINNYKVFKESSFQEVLPYQEISRDELVNPDSPYTNNNNWVPFTQNEMEKIQEIVPDAKYEIALIASNFQLTTKNARIRSNMYDMVIVKLIDEWYYVIDILLNDIKYFKCDQFDGLMKLIKNIVNGTYKKL